MIETEPIEAKEISLDTWYKFTETSSQKNIFLYSGWIKALLDTYHFPIKILALIKDGEISCAVPLMKVMDFKGKIRWVALPFSDYFHVPARTPEARTSFFTQLSLQPEMKKHCEFRDEVIMDEVAHSQTDWLHWIPLGPGIQENQERMRSNHRKSLAVARRKGGETRVSTDWQAVRDFYQLQLMTRKRKGLPVQPLRFFKNLHRRIIEQGHGFTVGVYLDDICIAGALCLHWGDVVTMKFSASDSNYYGLRPNHQVYWDVIEWGINNGYKTLDLGKTAMCNEGLRQFKLMWGAEEMELTYSHIHAGNIPCGEDEDEHPLIRLVSKTIMNGPVFVCQGIGELFYRFFV